MIAVVSRVRHAEVRVGGHPVGTLPGPGLVVLLGVERDDGDAQVSVMVRKLAELRLLRDERSVLDTGAAILLVSQFTLCGDTSRGRRPSWSAAARPAAAEVAIDRVVDGLRSRGVSVVTGIFGADMEVDSVNDGPYTVLVRT